MDKQASIASESGPQRKFGLVLLLDALGVSTLSTDTSIEFLERAGEFYQLLEGHIGRMTKFGELVGMHVPSGEMYTFGDTILLAWQTAMEDEIAPLANTMALAGYAVNVGVAYAFAMGLLLRGAMSIGAFVAEKNTVIGPAVADAARWYEDLDQIGVILTPRTGIMWDMILEANRSDTPDHLTKDAFVKYPIASKRLGRAEVWSIPWPIHFSMQVLSDDETELQPRDAFLRTMGSCDIMPGSESKYMNTLSYFDHVMEHHPIDDEAIKAHNLGVEHGKRVMDDLPCDSDDTRPAEGG